MRAPEARSDPSDAELVELVRGGDRRAFERLYHRHARRIAGLVYRLYGRDGDLDEVVQDVFVAAYDGIDRLRDPSKFGGWLSSIAVHHVRQRIAKKRRWRSVVERIAVPPPYEQSSGDAERALHALPAKLRMPFVLHRLDGFSVAETAHLCGVSEATTKRRCAEAARRLARRLT